MLLKNFEVCGGSFANKICNWEDDEDIVAKISMLCAKDDQYSFGK